MDENLKDGSVTFSKKKYREIEKAIYLMGTKSAVYNGHAGLLLIDKDKKGIFYSTVFSVEETPGVLSGKSAPFRLYKKELDQNQVKKYFETGKIPNIEDDLVTNFYLSNYNKYIIIPIKSKRQGLSIYKKAEGIYKNPKMFNLYQYNCGHITQDILKAGNTNFAPNKGELELVMKQFEDIKGSLKEWNLFMSIKKGVDAYRTDYELGIIPKGAFKRGAIWANEKGYEVGAIEPDNILQQKRKKWFMNVAIKDAVHNVNFKGEKPLSAVLVLNDKVMGRASDTKCFSKDPTLTPEIIAIRNGISKIKKENRKIDMSKLELFTTSEPSPMSVAAISLAGVTKVYAGASREDLEKFGINDTKIYDAFSRTPKRKYIDMKRYHNISNILKKGYGYDRVNGGKKDKAWIFKKRKDKNGNVTKKLIATGQDKFDKTNDVTSYAVVDAIRKTCEKTKETDLSKYEIISAYKPGPVSFAAIHAANFKKAVTGSILEPKNKEKFPQVVSTLRGEYDKSAFKMQTIERDGCLEILKNWKEKNAEKNFDQVKNIKTKSIKNKNTEPILSR